MNHYSIAYTVYDEATPNEKPEHKKYSFQSDNDILLAANEGMMAIAEKYEGTTKELLFRSINLDNAQEVYKNNIEQIRNRK